MLASIMHLAYNRIEVYHIKVNSMTIQGHAKVMQNFTICLPQKIRDEMKIDVKDTVMLLFKDGELTLKKAPSSWEDLAKNSPKVFQKYGGGEKYLKKERNQWYE